MRRARAAARRARRRRRVGARGAAPRRLTPPPPSRPAARGHRAGAGHDAAVEIPAPLATVSAPTVPVADSVPGGDKVERVQVTDPFIELHTFPGRGYPVFYVAARGEWISIELRHTDWYKVRTATGKVGWVTARAAADHAGRERPADSTSATSRSTTTWRAASSWAPATAASTRSR